MIVRPFLFSLGETKKGVRRPGLRPDRAADLPAGGGACQRADPDGHAQHRRPDDRACTAPTSRRTTSFPRILAGELHFAIGYTEPEAGTDLASLRTRAVRDGDEYVVNGQKVFTTGGHDSDYIWLACRTDPDAPKHKGISILLVDCTSPGFKWTPIHVLGGGHTNATYYEDVRVPVSRRVGEENGGWKMITTQLNFERVALGPAAGILKDVELVAEWARDTDAPEGGKVFDREWVRLEPGPHQGQGRGGRAVQLARRRVAGDRRAEPGRRVGDEGVRHRAADRDGADC